MKYSLKVKISFEESETPIYNQILEQEAIELHKMSETFENKNGESLSEFIAVEIENLNQNVTLIIKK